MMQPDKKIVVEKERGLGSGANLEQLEPRE